MDNGCKPAGADRDTIKTRRCWPYLSPRTQGLSDVYPFERFTELAKKVLAVAQEEAESSHHSYIGTEHVLLGLLREGDGIAAKVLNNLGVEIEKVRQTVESLVGRDKGLTVLQQIIPTSRVKKVIELSFEEARRTGHNYVGIEHLRQGSIVEDTESPPQMPSKAPLLTQFCTHPPHLAFKIFDSPITVCHN